jgi:hypothetical protein
MMSEYTEAELDVLCMLRAVQQTGGGMFTYAHIVLRVRNCDAEQEVRAVYRSAGLY